MRPKGYILASKTALIEESVQAEFINGFQPVFRADPRKALPVISQAAPDHIVRMPWGLSQKKRPEFYEYFTDTYGIIKRPYYRVLIRKTRCLVPANGILLGKNNKLYFLFSKSEPVLTFGGIYHTWRETDSPNTISGFSILTQQTSRGPDGTTMVLPILVAKNRRRGFLKDGKPMMDILPLLAREYKDHFKMYEVRNDLFKLNSPMREDIMPLSQKIISSRKEYNTINTKRYYY